ncbi:MAG: hypothetical protein AMXMBFR64_00990 [Myxococcales bacterium]
MSSARRLAVALLSLLVATEASAASLGTVLDAAPWSRARALSVSVLVEGREPHGEGDAALVAQARAELLTAARPRRVRLDLLGHTAPRARFSRLLELNLVPVGGGARFVVDATYYDLVPRPEGGYHATGRTIRPAAGGAMTTRVEMALSPPPPSDRAAALATHEQALRDRAASRAHRTRALVVNGEFSEAPGDRRGVAGLPTTRESLEGLVLRAFDDELAPFALIYAESAYNVRNRFVETVDRISEAADGALPEWWDGRPPEGVRRLRATDETIEERPWYATDGPRWAPYWERVGPRREAVVAAMEEFVDGGGLLVMEDEHCGEEPLAGIVPLRCVEQEEPARIDLRPADGSARPERVSVRSALWSRISSQEPDATCQPLVVAEDRRRWPEPLAVRCDRPEGGIALFTSFHADDLARDGALAQALYGGGATPSALEAALIDAPLSGPALQAVRPDGSLVTPVVVDRAAVRLGENATAAEGEPALDQRASLGIYVDAGELGYAQVGFRNGPLRAELRAPNGAVVAAREASTGPLLLDLHGRPRGLYELRLAGTGSVTVQHLSTVPRQRWTGATVAAWGAQRTDAVVIDGFARGAAGLPPGALGRLPTEAATLARLAMPTEGAVLVIEGHTSEDGSARANARLSLRRAAWAAGVLASALEAATGTACTVDGRTCASWARSLTREDAETDAVLRLGNAPLRVSLRPLGAAAPRDVCGPRDEPCLQRSRRVVVWLSRQ